MAVTAADDHRECLRRQHACATADLTAAALPRAAELFARLGAPLHDGFCPEPP